ncbi:MAG TPA: TetR/AcrR family transcriptional regulator [Opitutaceae bacterium]|nr:TetR/AcrR family transcriptional regulator [Opitutaceae bacterium]
MGRTSDADIRLMDAALDLIWEESYGAVSVDDICTRAGVKKGSFYHFFKTKADLAVAALERMWLTETKPQLDHDFSPSLNPLQRLAGNLERIYLYQIDVKKQHGKVLGCPVCSVGSEVSTQETDVGAKVCEIYSRKLRYYESMIRDAIAEGSIPPCDAHEKASALAGLIEGLTTQSRIMNDPEVLKNLPATALGFLGASPESVQTTLSR